MATSDYLITQNEVNAVHVAAQPDKLQGTAAQNKAVFDSYSDLIVTKFNAYVTANGEADDIDATVLALAVSMGWTPDE